MRMRGTVTVPNERPVHERRPLNLVFDSGKSKPIGWVAAGSYPPAAPTVPGVPHSGTRLLR